MSDVGSIDVWARVRTRRLALADRLEALSPEMWDRESWCTGWRVRDVLAHLVHLAEATQASMARDLLVSGVRPDPALRRIAGRMGDDPVPELAERLRRGADGHFHLLGSPRSVALGEVLVHGEDALRPLGLSSDIPPSDVRPVLDIYRRIGRLAFHGKRPPSVRLVATDLDWSSGRGPEVRGRAIDVLLLLANRSGAGPLLTGPGTSILA